MEEYLQIFCESQLPGRLGREEISAALHSLSAKLKTYERDELSVSRSAISNELCKMCGDELIAFEKNRFTLMQYSAGWTAYAAVGFQVGMSWH